MIFLFICDNNMDSHAYKVSLTRHIYHTCLLHRTNEGVMDSSGPGSPLYCAERACVRLRNLRPSLVCGTENILVFRIMFHLEGRDPIHFQRLHTHGAVAHRL
jgi:hypothetical protein